eukprot:scpid20349/ scgid0053/ Myosin-IIIb
MWSSKEPIPALSGLPEPGSRWELIEKIGSGTFGEVHKARDFTSGAMVAVKIMICESDKEQELEMEVNIFKNFCSPGTSHPNLPTFHGAFIQRSEERYELDRLWLIMELCRSGSMSELAKAMVKQNKTLSEDVIGYVMKETLKALVFLHSHDIIHRDVKGGNILLTHDAHVKLVDFGVCAQLKEKEQKRNTSIGTPYWMAPEVIACEHYLEAEYDARCDVWSFGITLIELCDSRPPLHTVPVNEAIFKIPRASPPTVKQPTQWSTSLNDIISRCLVKNYEKRPSIQDLFDIDFMKNMPSNTKPTRRQLMAAVDMANGGDGDGAGDGSDGNTSGEDTADKTDGDMTLRSGRRVGDELVNDLTKLEVLDESVLLHHLAKRYAKNIIYTNIGDILLAINPFQTLSIYDEKTSDLYRERVDDHTMPPHVYTIAGQCYQDMMVQRRNQCCVISGESGSGKTETAKYLVQQFTKLGKAINQNLESGILKVNPLFEAFGNASTVMNGNSSRFGKYLMLSFLPTGHIVSAQVSQYLLESSRVVFQAPGERNFHIFYYMYAGLSERSLLNRYQLININQHRYLRSSQSEVKQSAESNRAAFKDILKCFSVMAFSDMEVDNIIHILVAILHIGDVQIRADTFASASHGIDASIVANPDKLPVVASLLGLRTDDIVQALTTSVVTAKGEAIVRPNTVEDAEDCRDAMAKELYGRLFSWLVNRCNKHLQSKRQQHSELLEVGILDIFGFEDFKTNGFEQLFINITNEQIQYYFNQHIFAMEQAEYTSEGISASSVPFLDNSPCLAMFLQKPLGMLALLDEESRFPKATDNTLIDKFHTHLKDSEFYKAPRDNSCQFTITHYAGKVTYQVASFLEKNRNTLPVKMTELLFQAGNNLVQQLFDVKLTKTGNLPPQASASRLAAPRTAGANRTGKQPIGNKRVSQSKLMVKPAAGTGMTTSRRMQTSAWHFTNSLSELLTRMQNAQPHFIRCIKPNNIQQKSKFIMDKVQHQLKYTGVLESIRIRQKGYSHRILYSDFCERYRIIAYPLTQRVRPGSQPCDAIAKKCGLADYQLGKTKIFLRYFHMDILLKEYSRFDQSARLLQKRVRGWLAKRAYRKILQQRQSAAITLQSAIRGWILRRRYRRRKQRLIKAVIGVQACVRGCLVRQNVKRMRQERAASRVIQNVVRGWLTRIRYRRLLAKRQQSAIIIQTGMRRMVAQKELRRRREAKRRQELWQRNKAAIAIQTNVRRFLARRLLKRLKDARQRELQLLQKLHSMRSRAAVTIGKVIKGWLARVKYRRLLEKRSQSAIVLQRVYRQRMHRAHCRDVVRAKTLARIAEAETLERKRQSVLSQLLGSVPTRDSTRDSRRASTGRGLQTKPEASQVAVATAGEEIPERAGVNDTDAGVTVPERAGVDDTDSAVAGSSRGSSTKLTNASSASIQTSAINRVSDDDSNQDQNTNANTTVAPAPPQSSVEDSRKPAIPTAKTIEPSPSPHTQPERSMVTEKLHFKRKESITGGKLPRVETLPKPAPAAPPCQVKDDKQYSKNASGRDGLVLPASRKLASGPEKHDTDGAASSTDDRDGVSATPLPTVDSKTKQQLDEKKSAAPAIQDNWTTTTVVKDTTTTAVVRDTTTTTTAVKGDVSRKVLGFQQASSQRPSTSNQGPSEGKAAAQQSARNIRVSQLAAKFNQIWSEPADSAAKPPAAAASRPTTRPGKLTRPAAFQADPLQQAGDTSFLPLATQIRTKGKQDRKKVGFFEFTFQ